MPDLRRLQYFLAVAEERNFTRAAARLHIAQPALSRQVRQLEQELGVELLHRTTHDFELTEAGRFLLDRGPQLLAMSEELWRSVRSFGSGELGTLRQQQVSSLERTRTVGPLLTMGGSAAWFSQMQPGRIYTETRRRATVSATRRTARAVPERGVGGIAHSLWVRSSLCLSNEVRDACA